MLFPHPDPPPKELLWSLMVLGAISEFGYITEIDLYKAVMGLRKL